MDFLNWLVKRLIDPAALIWLSLLILAAFHYCRKHRLEASVHLGLALLLSLFAGTSFGSVLIYGLEKPYYREGETKVEEGSVVVVLGGYLNAATWEPHGFDAGSAVDRLLAGVELVRSGKAELLLLGGGSADWRFSKTEASVVTPWAERWNLIDVPIENIGLCRNTREEALAVQLFLETRGLERVVLVTSALHMKRAEAVFRKVGVAVEPVACDFSSDAMILGEPFDYNLIPKSGRMTDLHRYLRECVGWMAYRARGWID